MNGNEMILAELLALRCSVAALAREILLRNGSEAFVHAEAQAKHFAANAAHSGGAFSDAMRERAIRVTSDIFAMGDSA